MDFNDGYDLGSLFPSTSLPEDIFDPFDQLESNTIPDVFSSTDQNTISCSIPSPNVFDRQLLLDLEPLSTTHDYGYSVPINDPLSNVQINENNIEALEILAQPKSAYRPRYASEIDQANRFIRTNPNNQQYSHPTVKIPSWCQCNQQWFIRVTLLTIRGSRTSKHYIHPYDLITSDPNAIRDEQMNSLFFRINDQEYQTRVKSFSSLLIVKKKQEDLQNIQLRSFSLEHDQIIDIDDTSNSKERKYLYQLSKSQFLFTIIQRENHQRNFISFANTSILSDIMTGEISATTHQSPRNRSLRLTDNQCQCIPQKGMCVGGENIVVFLPQPIKNNKYAIAFNFGDDNLQFVEFIRMDTRTILFETPRCPLPIRDGQLKVSIIIRRNQILLSTLDFFYIACNETSTTNKRPFEQDMKKNRTRYKRFTDYYQHGEVDTAGGLIHQMHQLSIEKIDIKPSCHGNTFSSNTLSDEQLHNLDRRLAQIKSGLELFVRTNNPSELFRATGFLLSKYTGHTSPLHDAIENGHNTIALIIIEQTIHFPSNKNLLEKVDTHGRTPLLLAAKKNQWEILELILRHRLDLTKQKDYQGNHFLHLLAQSSDEQRLETLEKILRILPSRLQLKLFNETNKQNQTLIDIAKFHKTTAFLKLCLTKQNDLK